MKFEAWYFINGWNEYKSNDVKLSKEFPVGTRYDTFQLNLKVVFDSDAERNSFVNDFRELFKKYYCYEK